MIPKDLTFDVTYPESISKSILEIIGSVRREVLRQFIRELMVVLQGEGYLIHEVVSCLADFAEFQQDADVAQCLDETTESLLNIHRTRRDQETSISSEEA
jgi:hypothetical protein